MSERRNHFIIRLKDDERKEIGDLARMLNVSMAEVCRLGLQQLKASTDAELAEAAATHAELAESTLQRLRGGE